MKTTSNIPHSDFKHRRAKAAFCAVALLASISLTAAAVRVVLDRHGLGTPLEWAGPALFAGCAWRFAGWSWMYITQRHAPWSYEYLRIWWRMTGRRD